MTGMLFGALFASGFILCANVLRKPSLSMSDKISPYVGMGSTKSLNFTQQFLAAINSVLTTRSWSPWSKNDEISKWLRQSESEFTLSGFRRKQIIFAGYSTLAATVWALLRLSSGKGLSPVLALALLFSAFIGGGWYAKWSLASQANKRRLTIEEQLPAVLDLLAFAVSAGEPVLLALRRISKSCTGPLVAELANVVNSVNSGDGLVPALNQMSSQIESQPLTRATHSLELALERGTPLVQVLRAQAADARAHQLRMLLVLAGHKETSMMLPVVFLILPMIVAVALYPGMIALQVL
jgi:tight adherence protein C